MPIATPCSNGPTATAVTLVWVLKSLMAAANAIELLALSLLLRVVSDTVSSATVVARMVTPLITRSPALSGKAVPNVVPLVVARVAVEVRFNDESSVPAVRPHLLMPPFGLESVKASSRVAVVSKILPVCKPVLIPEMPTKPASMETSMLRPSAAIN